ncbi:MAG: protein tyrosine phosphatase (PTP) superfamily phosphohydrolase (DUF442 family) [Pseudohongiellaceae bacterium]|jgi:protein tyrosine phosphatase (PTP) superfamily phosphohydrolase (DUF442 family)
MVLRSTLLPALMTLLAVGCSSHAAESESTSMLPTADLSALSTLAGAQGIHNLAYHGPKLWTAGQLSEEQLMALGAAGMDLFISLRLDNENGAGGEEMQFQDQPGHFVRLPVAGKQGITFDNARLLAELLAAHADETVTVYCGSSNRVGALFALMAYDIDGLSGEQAIDIGVAHGLSSLKPLVRELLELPAAP